MQFCLKLTSCLRRYCQSSCISNAATQYNAGVSKTYKELLAPILYKKSRICYHRNCIFICSTSHGMTHRNFNSLFSNNFESSQEWEPEKQYNLNFALKYHSDVKNSNGNRRTISEPSLNKNKWETLLDNEDKRKNISSIPTRHENIVTLPNLLSVSRIIMTPCISYLAVSEQYSLALFIFMIASFTDVLDGQIARRWPSQKSAVGSALDPLGDKILVTTLTITLSCIGIIPVPLTVLIVGRDVLLVGSVFYLRYRTCPPPVTLKRYFDPTLVNAKLSPTGISKVNTGLQMAVIWLSMCAPVFDFVSHPLLNSLYALTAVTTLWSGASYVFDKTTVKILKVDK